MYFISFHLEMLIIGSDIFIYVGYMGRTSWFIIHISKPKYLYSTNITDITALIPIPIL